MSQVRVDFTQKYTKDELLQLAIAHYWDEKKEFDATQAEESAGTGVARPSAAKIAKLYGVKARTLQKHVSEVRDPLYCEEFKG
jgi:hypothetical protein